MNEEFKEGYRQGYRDGYQDCKNKPVSNTEVIPLTEDKIDMPTVSDEWIKENIKRCSVCQATVMQNSNCGLSYCPQDPFYYLV